MSDKRLQVHGRSRDRETWIFSLVGNLFGSSEAYAFQEEIRRTIAAGARKIVVDLAAVEKIDSSGVGILVAVMWSASRAGGGMVLATIPPRVEKVLDIVMLLDHIDHADSVDEALAKLDGMKLEGS